MPLAPKPKFQCEPGGWHGRGDQWRNWYGWGAVRGMGCRPPKHQPTLVLVQVLSLRRGSLEIFIVEGLRLSTDEVKERSDKAD